MKVIFIEQSKAWISFLLFLWSSLILLACILFGCGNWSLGYGYCNWSEQSLFAMLFGGLDSSWVGKLFKNESCNWSNNLKLFNNLRCRNVLSKFRNSLNKTFVGCFVNEDSMINFLFSFSFSPFLDRMRGTLWPPFFWVAALAIWSFDFFWPVVGCFPWINTYLPLKNN